MSYMRASTANPNGWRPGTVRLGEMRRRPAPDWKVANANQDAIQGIYNQQQAAARGRAMAGMALVDARARGVGMPIFRRALSGLGLNAINLQGPMVNGFPYVFHFSWGGLGVGVDPNSIASTIAADTNFANPVAAQESGGMQVSFTYAGISSTVANAGAEMQTVINDNLTMQSTFTTLAFYAAEGGPATQTTPANPVNSTTPPGAPPAPNTGFSLSNLLSSSGLASLGIGAALALALGVVLVVKEL